MLNSRTTAPGLWTAIALLVACGAALPAAGQTPEGPVELGLLATARTLAADLADHSVRHALHDQLWDQEAASHYGLVLDEGWQAAAAASPKLPLVILIHGFNSTPARNAPLLAPVRAAGFPTAIFAYPNDWSLTKSATMLSTSLKEFHAAHPGMRVALVTHSMGGLVARECIEDAALDPGNVARIVMIAPPTHGSLIAHVSFAGDLWEHGFGRADGSAWLRFRDSIVDGLGEASDDLIPGSPFLTRLNARARNPRVRYAILLGTRTAVTEPEFEGVRWMLRKTARAEGLGRYAASLDGLAAELDEVVDGKGDGVVAVKRGRLAGVDDVLLLPFDHMTCTGEPLADDESDAARQVQAAVLVRLTASID